MKQIVFFSSVLVLIMSSLFSYGDYTNPVYGISLAFANPGVTFKFDQDNPSQIDSLSYVNERYYQSGDIINGKWYVVSAFQGANELWVIDTTSGVETKVADLSQAIVGITYSVITQKTYACDNTNLYTLDLISGELTLIGAMGNLYCMKGLSSNNNGEIYGIEWANSNIYKIDPLTAQASPIAVMTDTIVYPLDGKINRNTNEYILSSMTNSSHGTFHLYKINLHSGLSTDLGEVAKTAQLTALAIPYKISEQSEFKGFVLDTENNPVKNAKVKITNSTSTLTTLTDAQGKYDFPVVYPGTYDFEVSAEHYITTGLEDIQINLGQILSYDFNLTLSALSVQFIVTNSQLESVSGTLITLVSDSLYTNANGKALFEHVSPGTYTYKTFTESYYNYKGQVTLADANQEISIKLIADVNIKRNLVVLEEGTGTWCQYCPAAANGLEDLTNADYPIAVIAYHSGEDDYETDESGERLDYYIATSYPTVYFDGNTVIRGGAPADYSMFEEYKPVVNEKIKVTTPIGLNVSNITYNKDSREFSAQVTINVIGVAYGDDNRLMAALTESGIAESWQGLDSLQFVERAMFNGSDGTNVDLSTIGSSITTNVSFTLDSNWNEKRCQVVFFAQDHDSKEILNGAKIDISDFITGAIAENSNLQIQLYPNPAVNSATILGIESMDQVTVIDINGKTVVFGQSAQSDKLTLDITSLTPGIYFVKVKHQLNGNIEYLKLIKK